MKKELQDLLDNYERSIYGKEVPKIPTIHQIHLLLDYIANQGVQLKKQKEIIDKIEEKIKEYIKNAKYEITTLTITDRVYYKYLNDMLDDLLQILEDKEV